MEIGYGGYVGKGCEDDCRKNVKHTLVGGQLFPATWVCSHGVEHQISIPNFEPFPDLPCYEKEDERVSDLDTPGVVAPRPPVR